MKVKLTENELRRIVHEGTRRALYEIRLNESIRRSVNESLEALGYNGVNEGESEDGASRRYGDNDDRDRRLKVIHVLQSPQVDLAQYAYKLWPNKDKDSARSYFYKCLNREKDDNGNGKQTTDT